MKLLLVEDDHDLSQYLQKQLLLEDFEVDIARDGIIAEKLIRKHHYDCILLDIDVPGKNGYELARMIRDEGKDTPIIMLTAYSELEDKLNGFSAGTDDYITKPFFFEELLVRINALLKRSSNNASNKSAIGDLVINHAKKEVTRSGKVIRLTPREYEIISILMEADGSPVSKKAILKRVWGTTFDAASNTIEVFINMLRNKVDKDHETKLIKTRVGYGYYISTD